MGGSPGPSRGIGGPLGLEGGAGGAGPGRPGWVGSRKRRQVMTDATKSSRKLPTQGRVKANDPGGVNTNEAMREVPGNCQQKAARHSNMHEIKYHPRH